MVATWSLLTAFAIGAHLFLIWQKKAWSVFSPLNTFYVGIAGFYCLNLVNHVTINLGEKIHHLLNAPNVELKTDSRVKNVHLTHGWILPFQGFK